MSTLWCISASGGAMNPAASNAQPKLHITVAIMSCKRFITTIVFISTTTSTTSVLALRLAPLFSLLPAVLWGSPCRWGVFLSRFRSNDRLRRTFPSGRVVIYVVFDVVLNIVFPERARELICAQFVNIVVKNSPSSRSRMLMRAKVVGNKLSLLLDKRN